MSFVNINEYGEYKLPIAGNVTKYTVCESIDSYKPYDVGDVSSSIDYVCENIKEVNHCDGLNKNLSDLNEQWGEKFIAIDGKNIGIVLPDEFNTQFESITEHINEQADRCEKIVGDIVSRLQEVNEYYNQLKSNLDEYKKLLSDKESYENEIARYDNLIISESAKEKVDSANLSKLFSSKNSCEVNLRNVNTELDKYTIIPEPEGQWIVV